MVNLYQCFIFLYILGIRIASLWNPKAAEWVRGRKNLFQDLEAKRDPSRKLIWFHCASAGELEQGKPLVEQLKELYPEHQVLISFFSHSGMAAGKKYNKADLITYLPADTRANARRFIETLDPDLVIFVKYEYWYHHLAAISEKKIPLLLVSAIFRDSQPFFKWYGGFFRQLLFFFQHIFVQDRESMERVNSLGVRNVSVSGDTRFDRVLKLVRQPPSLPIVKDFCENGRVVVAGSTWPEDEALLQALLVEKNVKLVIAPHEINRSHLDHITTLFPGSILFSAAGSVDLRASKVLVIDNYGMLSQLYPYGDVTYIGGGFNKSGIHNTLEAAVWGRPVCFGPHYQKFREARDLVKAGAAKSIDNAAGLKKSVMEWLDNATLRGEAGKAAAAYVEKNGGATKMIMGYIQENRLLTS